MARKAAQKAAQKKAAKQKKMLIVLGVVFVIALIYAGMTLSNLNSSSGVQAVPAASTTPAGTGTPSAGTSTTAAPATAPTATPGVATAPPGSLRAFTGLGRKDPFNDNGPSTASTSKR